MTRGELFFARGVILVEGDAEKFLVPAFAEVLGIALDVLGISVCSVGGTNFAPYVKLLGPSGLSIPFVVLTDLDPNGTRPPRARARVETLLDIIEPKYDYSDGTDDEMFEWGREQGIFVNGSTLEVELFGSGLEDEIRSALEAELSMSEATLETLQEWVDDPDRVDADGLLKLIERVGKGRLAQRLAAEVSEDTCPDYIRLALERIRDAVT